MNIIVTGGSGFIGGYVYRHLRDEGFNVYNFDVTGSDDDQCFYRGSILDRSKLIKVISDADYVFHFAAFSNINHVRSSPIDCVELNVMGTANILESIRINGNRAVHVFASSVYTHDNNGHLYTTSKKSGERICNDYRSLFGTKSIIARLGTVYGEKSRHEDVLSIFSRKMCNNQEVTVHGDGLQTRNFIHGLDVAAACKKIIDLRLAEGDFIMAGHESVSINDVISMLSSMGKLDYCYKDSTDRVDDYMGNVGDVNATYDRLDWRPSIDIYNGL